MATLSFTQAPLLEPACVQNSRAIEQLACVVLSAHVSLPYVSVILSSQLETYLNMAWWAA